MLLSDYFIIRCSSFLTAADAAALSCVATCTRGAAHSWRAQLRDDAAKSRARSAIAALRCAARPYRFARLALPFRIATRARPRPFHA